METMDYVPEPEIGELCLMSCDKEKFNNNIGTLQTLRNTNEAGFTDSSGRINLYCRPVRLAPEPTYTQDKQGNIYATIDARGLPWVEEGQKGWLHHGRDFGHSGYRVNSSLRIINGCIYTPEGLRFDYFTWLVKPAPVKEFKINMSVFKHIDSIGNITITREEWEFLKNQIDSQDTE